jgi:Fe2+ transport system protein FeoA
VNLNDLKKGSFARVIEVLDDSLALALAEHGIGENQLVQIVHRAPFKGPIIVSLGDHEMSMRIEEAMDIKIKIEE